VSALILSGKEVAAKVLAEVKASVAVLRERTGAHPTLAVILVGEAYWRHVLDPDFLMAEGTIDPEDRDLFWYAETAEEIWRDILLWYELKGEPLLPPDVADEFCRPDGKG